MNVPTKCAQRIGTAVILISMVAGCARTDRGNESDHSLSAPIVGLEREARCPELGDAILPPSLLDLDDPREIQRVIDQCLHVDETMARAVARAYAEREMGMQAPVSVRLVLPVEDSLGTLIAHQVILSSGAGDDEGFPSLWEQQRSLARTIDPSDPRTPFRQIHDLTAESHATINVAAYLYRHPINRAHRGIPRWLAEHDEVIDRCPGALLPLAILPAEGIPGAVRLVRYACGRETFLFSHYANAALAADDVRTRHFPRLVFDRWSERVSSGYDDPAERLRFLEGLWLRFLTEGGQR